MPYGYEVAVTAVEVLEDQPAPVEEVVKGLRRRKPTLCTYFLVGLVEFEKECRLVEQMGAGREALDEVAHRLHLRGEDGALAGHLSEVIAEEGQRTLRGEDEAQGAETLRALIEVVAGYLGEEGARPRHGLGALGLATL